jgi:hypothetical protein
MARPILALSCECEQGLRSGACVSDAQEFILVLLKYRPNCNTNLFCLYSFNISAKCVTIKFRPKFIGV